MYRRLELDGVSMARIEYISGAWITGRCGRRQQNDAGLGSRTQHLGRGRVEPWQLRRRRHPHFEEEAAETQQKP